MKCGPDLGKVLTLPLILLLLGESYAHYWNGRNPHQTNKHCPRGTTCVVSIKCRHSNFRSPREPMATCGYAYNRIKMICCPEKRRFVPTFGTVNSKDCGKVNGLQGVNAGLNPAKQGAWPWMVGISKRHFGGKLNHICAGALITSRHVLSAAHCFKWRKPSQYIVRIGHVNRNVAHEYKISGINVPDTFKHNRYYDDIAVVTLSRDVNTKNVSPICLPPSPEYVNLTGNSTTSVGWASIVPKSPRSAILFEFPGIPFIPSSRCSAILRQKLWKNFKREFPRGFPDTLICAGFLKGERGNCWGESGEPMMHQQGGRWYAVGVLAFGAHNDCHRPGVPTGYTKVSKYLNWILQIIRT